MNKEKQKEILEKNILKLHNENRSNRYIAKELRVARSTVKNYLDKHGKKTPMPYIRLERKDGQLKCLECNNFKDEELFYNSKNRPSCGTCRSCRTEKRRKKKNLNLQNFFQYKWRSTKDRASRYSIPFELSVEDLLNQYKAQDKKCFYTDEEFAPFTEIRNRNTLSVDRINSSLGYNKNNIVLCTFRVNTAKGNFTLKEMEQWMPEWARRIKELNKL